MSYSGSCCGYTAGGCNTLFGKSFARQSFASQKNSRNCTEKLSQMEKSEKFREINKEFFSKGKSMITDF